MFFKASPKRMIEKYLRIVSSARKKAASAEDMQTIGSRINGKLAQRLDSAGFHDVAEHIVLGREGSSTDVTPEGNVETAKKAGLLSMLIEGYRSRPLSRRLMLLGGGAVVGGAGFLAVLAVMVWYRGGTLVRIGEQGVAPSILSLEKKIETEYGVGVSSNSFTIVAQNGAVFRAQGIEHRITLVPPIELDVVLSPDGKRVTVTPAEDLVPETEYRLSLIEGTSFSDGTALPDDFTWAFRTEPVFAVTGITPRDGSCCAPVDTAIEIEFNYKNVDPEVLSDYFTIDTLSLIPI